jgi:hypothetical protein
VALSFLYRLVGCVAEAISTHQTDGAAKDAEILRAAPPTRRAGAPGRRPLVATRSLPLVSEAPAR